MPLRWLISSRADPCKLVQLRDVTLEVFTASTDFSSPSTYTHTHTHTILKTFTHSIQRSIYLPNRSPQREKRLWKTATDGASPLEPLVTSQTAPHCSPSPPQRPVSLIWFSEVDGFQKAFSVLLNCRCVYRIITAWPVPSRRQRHTLLALISGPLDLL